MNNRKFLFFFLFKSIFFSLKFRKNKIRNSFSDGAFNRKAPVLQKKASKTNLLQPLFALDCKLSESSSFSLLGLIPTLAGT